MKAEVNQLKREERRFATILLIIPIMLFLIFGLYIYVASIILVFQKVDYLGHKTFLAINDIFLNFKNFFIQMNGEGQLLKISILNSVKVWFVCNVISNPLYIIFSYFIFKKCRGYRFVRLVVMIPEIISGLIFCLVFKMVVNEPLIEVMQRLGATNFPNLLDNKKYAYGVVLFYRLWVSFGTSTILYSNAIAAISPDLFESAQIDGINNMFQEIGYIILPQIYGTFKVLFIIGLSGMFSTDNGLVTFYKYGAPAETYVFGYYNTVKIFNASSEGYPVLAAGGLVFTVIFAPIVFIVKKYMDKIDPCL